MGNSALDGREFARRFHTDLVAPLLARGMPGLRYAAGRLGSGSDVLGFDDEMSRDHDWGCRLNLLVDEPDRDAVPRIRSLLERELPESYRGYPVRFGVTWDTTPTHKVDVATVTGFAVGRLGVDPAAGLSALDWLILTGQNILEVTAGPVFTDRTSALGPVRAALAWYPPDVERYVLASGWRRVAEQMPLAARAAGRGDELGSRLVSAQLAGELMWLSFAVSRQWPPYAKWRGTAFRGLVISADLERPLTAVASAPDWSAREDAVAGACEVLLSAQRELGLPTPATALGQFWGRPYRSVDPAVHEALLAGISDPFLARLPGTAGSVDQWASGDDILTSTDRRSALRAVYRAWAQLT